MAIRPKSNRGKAERLTAVQLSEAAYQRCSELLSRHCDIPLAHAAHGIAASGKPSDTIMRGTELDAYLVSAGKVRGNDGLTLDLAQRLRGTFVTLETKSGLRLRECFIDAQLPRYSRLRKVLRNGKLQAEAASKAEAMLAHAHGLSEVFIYNPRVLRLDTVRSTANVWIAASMAFKQDGTAYLLDGIIVRVDVDAAIDGITDWLSASGTSEPSANDRAALAALKQYKSGLDVA